MKYSIPFSILFVSTLILAGCLGSDLKFDDPVQSITLPSIPSGATMYLDASYPAGTSTTSSRPTGCSSLYWSDLSGSSITGQLTNFTCSGSSGWIGSGSSSDPYAVSFDNAGRVTTSLVVSPAAMPSTTWEVWVKPTRVNFGTRQQIMSSDNGGYDRSLLIESNTSNISVFTGAGVWSPTSITANQWQHIAVVFTATGISAYKNGMAFSFGSAPTFDASSSNLMIGANPAFGENFQGAVALFAIYNRALSATEISDHCKSYQDRFAVTCN